MSVAAGSRLGVYEILALLGAGGMVPYIARDTKLGRDVALKAFLLKSVKYPPTS